MQHPSHPCLSIDEGDDAQFQEMKNIYLPGADETADWVQDERDENEDGDDTGDDEDEDEDAASTSSSSWSFGRSALGLASP